MENNSYLRNIRYSGVHLLIDLFDCDELVLYNNDIIKDIITTAVKLTGATILASEFHNFEPQGSSGIFLLSESHSSYHTFPEERLINIDLFTCGNINPELGLEYLKINFKPKSYLIKKEYRGLH